MVSNCSESNFFFKKKNLLLRLMFSKMLTFEVHYGGRFEFEPLLSYVDGKICYFDEDETNFLSSVEWFNSLKRLGLPYDQEIYYKLPICTFEDRLRICNNDGSVVTMVEHCLLLDIVVTYI